MGHKYHTVQTSEGRFELSLNFGWKSSTRLRLTMDQPHRVTTESHSSNSWMKVFRFTHTSESAAYRIEGEDDIGYSILFRADLPGPLTWILAKLGVKAWLRRMLEQVEREALEVIDLIENRAEEAFARLKDESHRERLREFLDEIKQDSFTLNTTQTSPDASARVTVISTGDDSFTELRFQPTWGSRAEFTAKGKAKPLAS